jgi:putative hydrolase of the HAD superfamily
LNHNKVTNLQSLPIKTIIFDLGGVIIDIEPQRSITAFAQHINGLRQTNVYQHQLFHELETGAITSAEFRNRLRATLNTNLEDAIIDHCMIAMLGDIPGERLLLLEKMKQRYTTLLLSNTNAIHYDACAGILHKAHRVPTFDHYFHKTYYSHLVGFRKPDIRIFELMIRENNLIPSETLFLDDLGENLKSARSLGIITIKVTPENSILDILKDF